MRLRAGPVAEIINLEGERFAIDDALTLGRSSGAGLVIADSQLARQHFALLRLPSGDIELTDLQSTNGTFVNRKRVLRTVLRNGDIVRAGRQRWVIEVADTRAPVDPLLLKVAEAPDDDAVWAVWSDHLLERGDPRGEAIASAPSDNRAALTSELIKAVEGGSLHLDWRHGFIRGAALRDLHLEPGVRPTLFSLLRHPLAELIVELSLPHAPAGTGLTTAPLPALRTLRLGPFFVDVEAEAQARELAQAPLAFAPFLKTLEVIRFERAWLEEEGQPNVALTAPAATRLGSAQVGWQEGNHPSRWTVSRTAQGETLRINGRSRFSATLVPGDVIEVGVRRWLFRA